MELYCHLLRLTMHVYISVFVHFNGDLIKYYLNPEGEFTLVTCTIPVCFEKKVMCIAKNNLQHFVLFVNFQQECLLRIFVLKLCQEYKAILKYQHC